MQVLHACTWRPKPLSQYADTVCIASLSTRTHFRFFWLGPAPSSSSLPSAAAAFPFFPPFDPAPTVLVIEPLELRPLLLDPPAAVVLDED
jgi:hypothetical protein